MNGQDIVFAPKIAEARGVPVAVVSFRDIGNKQRGLTQERLGARSSLSGRFIGEVERGDKSISVDSLCKVSEALQIP